jgi:Zn-dependent protease
VDRPRVVGDERDRRLDPTQAPEPGTLPDPEPGYAGERGYEPLHPRWGVRDFVRKLFAPLIAVGFLILKYGALLLKLKVLTTAGSMLVSIAAYAWIWGLPFAVGFVVLIFIHEFGHVLELRRQGVPASAPLFIPFLGAVIGMKQLPDDAWKEARVALAGPIVGSVGAAAFLVAGTVADSDLLRALAFVGFFLNLFNLVPIVPLDGGRAVGAIHPVVWLLGLVMMVALAVVSPNPILFLIVIIGGLELWRRWRERGERAEYYRLPLWQKVTVATVYIGLIVILGIAVSETHVERDF